MFTRGWTAFPLQLGRPEVNRDVAFATILLTSTHVDFETTPDLFGEDPATPTSGGWVEFLLLQLPQVSNSLALLEDSTTCIF